MASDIWVHDPQAVLDYTFDWSRWLASGETITTATVTGDGVTIDSTDTTTTTVAAWVSGGTLGEIETVKCAITTSGGRTDERTIRLSIRER